MAGHCPTCGVPVRLVRGVPPNGRREAFPVALEATGMVALVPPDPMAAVAQWHVRVTYPLHPPRCSAPSARPGGILPR